MDRLNYLLEKGFKQLFVVGEGGLGKTEFATSAAYALKRKYQFFFISYDKTLKQTIRNLQFKNWQPYIENDGQKIIKSEEIQYVEKLQLLMNLESAVLIIDNYDQTPELMLEELGTLPNWDIRLLITTRTAILGKGEQSVEIKPFSPQELLGLMRKYVNADYADQDLLDLINKVHCHTLLVDLIARILANDVSGIHPQQLLKELNTNNWLGDTLSEKLPIEYNRNHEYRSVLGHLNALFNVSNLSDNAIYILCCSSLLSDSGLNEKVFVDCFSQLVEYRHHIQLLRDTGWLKHDRIRKIYFLHPLIRLVCKNNKKTKPDWFKVRSFWQKVLWTNRFSADELYEQVELAISVRPLIKAAAALDDWAINEDVLASIYHKVGLYEKSIEFALNALEIRYLTKPRDYEAIAISCNGIAVVYLDMGRRSDAEEYALKCIDALHKAKAPNPENEAKFLETAALVYRSLDKHTEAQKYAEKAVTVCKEHLSGNHPQLGQSYLCLGSIYYEQHAFQEALTFVRLATDILGTIYSDKHSGVITANHMLGMILLNTKKYTEANELLIKTHQAQMAVLAPNHPALATSYNNVGMSYYFLGLREKALDCFLNAKQIIEVSHSVDPMHAATIFINIGRVYYDLEAWPDAVEHQLIALNNRKSVLPEKHIDIACVAKTVARTYLAMGNYKDALPYLLDAFAIYCNAGRLYISDATCCCEDICSCYSVLGDHKNEQKYLKQVELLSGITDS